uniref:Putative secreted protein n=1 Tax=Anopheles triannulatus TaxID=58253 RepID=A0A2M4B3Y7_9DIPT
MIHAIVLWSAPAAAAGQATYWHSKIPNIKQSLDRFNAAAQRRNGDELSQLMNLFVIRVEPALWTRTRDTTDEITVHRERDTDIA